MANNNNNSNNGNISQGLGASTVAPDPATLWQAILTFVSTQQDVIANGSGANYSSVVMGWAEAITAVQNPINTLFEGNDAVLYDLFSQLQNGQGGPVPPPTLLFNTTGSVAVGDWVYQNGNDAVSVSDSSAFSTGPVLGVVVDLPSQTTARIQNVGSFVYTANSHSFLPLIADSAYYADTLGNITTSPTPPPGGFIQEVGYSKTTLELVLNLQEPTLV